MIPVLRLDHAVCGTVICHIIFIIIVTIVVDRKDAVQNYAKYQHGYDYAGYNYALRDTVILLAPALGTHKFPYPYDALALGTDLQLLSR